MSALTDALFFNLQQDLEGHLDAYQVSKLGEDVPMWPDITQRQYAAVSLARSLFKKYNDSDRPSREASKSALTKFISCNDSNAAYQVQCESILDEELINDVSDELHRFWYIDGCSPLVSTFNQLYERGKLGKGSNRAARGHDLYTKVYDSPLSHSSETLSFLWQRLSASDPRHLLAEQMRCSRYGFKKVEGNSLSFVNKNVTIARGICTEPTINMWFQLGMAAFLTDRLWTRYGIDLSIQPEVNRAMARIGSVTGRFATIDLESASDLISIELCKRLLPRSMLGMLMTIRSPATRLPSEFGGGVAELHSISTMGNGFTFPLMTAIFCAVVAVVYRRLGYPLERGGSKVRTFSVFGDDIIIHPGAARLLYKTLALMGFKVNVDKSHVEGAFRESCGADFYLGFPVRGVYIKRLKTVQDHVVAINGLNHWSATTKVNLPHTVGCLLRSASKLGHVLRVPADENDDSGVHVPLDMARGVKHSKHGLIRYQRYLPRCRYLSIDTEAEVITVTGNAQPRSYNPHGLWLAFLHGTLRSGRVRGKMEPRISLQAKGAVTYLTRPRVSASWDALAPHVIDDDWGFLPRFYDWRRWSDAARTNLLGPSE